MKGFAVVIVGFFIVAVAVITEVTYLTNFIQKSLPIIRAVRETEIIHGINRLEFAKQYLLKSALYSYYQASYDVASRGGYFELANSYNCVPYLKIYSQDFAPDLESNLKTAISSVFTKYITTVDFDDVKIPTSFVVDLSNHKVLTINSADNLQVGTEDFYTAEEIFSFSQTVDGKIFDLFNVAKNAGDSTTDVEKTAISFSDLQSKLNLLQEALNVNYASQNIHVVISAENLGSSDADYAARILVSIGDNSQKIPSYDFSTKTFAERNLVFQFYLLEGKSNLQPPTNTCENIAY